MGDTPSTTDIFEQDLGRRPANYMALSPVGFLARAAAIFPRRVAVIHGARRYHLCGVPRAARRHGGGDRAQRAGAARGAFRRADGRRRAERAEHRLDAATIAFILEHGEAKVLIADREFARSRAARGAATASRSGSSTSTIPMPDRGPSARRARLRGASSPAGDPAFRWSPPADEWQAIALNYTSGTTGNPKGVVYHHRGAYLNALGNMRSPSGLRRTRSICGRCRCSTATAGAFTWTVTRRPARMSACAGSRPARDLRAIAEHGVTHLCGAPIVLNMLIHAPARAPRLRSWSRHATGGAAPPAAVIAAWSGSASTSRISTA
jgi:fatty-acyl-CoA synthase